MHYPQTSKLSQSFQIRYIFTQFYPLIFPKSQIYKMNEEIEARVLELGKRQAWNHNFVLPNGIETRPGTQVSHGKNLVKWERIQPLLYELDISDKRILDIGCNEGFFSFEIQKQGAEVTGIDVDSSRIEKAKFIGEVLEMSAVEFREMSIFDRGFDELPEFDICLCLGFLHRVPDPFTALQKLTQKSNIILLEWKALKFGPHDEPFAFFTPGEFNQEDYYGTQFWVMSYACVEAMLSRLGFNHFFRFDDPSSKRAILVTGRISSPIFNRPDTILRRSRFRSFLSHTKRYLLMIMKIITGKVNF